MTLAHVAAAFVLVKIVAGLFFFFKAGRIADSVRANFYVTLADPRFRDFVRFIIECLADAAHHAPECPECLERAR